MTREDMRTASPASVDARSASILEVLVLPNIGEGKQQESQARDAGHRDGDKNTEIEHAPGDDKKEETEKKEEPINPEGEEEEEEPRSKLKRMLKLPAQREREEHETLHIPFRSWRKHCAAGRSQNSPHK